MNIFKRIKNLWTLSELTVSKINEGKTVFIDYKKDPATIVEPDVIEQLTEDLK